MKLGPLILSAALAGAMCAQATAPTSSQPTTPPAKMQQNRNPRSWTMQKLTSDLNLTTDQQAKAKTIFNEARVERKSLTPRLRDERSSVVSAIKANNPAQIDRVIQKDANVNAQAAEIHAKAMAKFYAMLTPAQQSKMDQKMAHFMSPMTSQHRAMPPTGSL